MRIGSAVLLHKQCCVQSYGWNCFRPLGQLQGVLDSLEEYHCDEVAIIRPVRQADSIEFLKKDVEIMRSLNIMTPISFGGGIRSLEHLNLLKDLPIERLVFSSAFLEGNTELITSAKNLFGHQAIQCLLPIMKKNNMVYVYHSSKSRYIPLSEVDIGVINELANEIVLVDLLHEGLKNQFDWSLLDMMPFLNDKIIISGGVGKETLRCARDREVASVLIDNKVLHQEYSISGYKHATVLS